MSANSADSGRRCGTVRSVPTSYVRLAVSPGCSVSCIAVLLVERSYPSDRVRGPESSTLRRAAESAAEGEREGLPVAERASYRVDQISLRGLHARVRGVELVLAEGVRHGVVRAGRRQERVDRGAE